MSDQMNQPPHPPAKRRSTSGRTSAGATNKSSQPPDTAASRSENPLASLSHDLHKESEPSAVVKELGIQFLLAEFSNLREFKQQSQIATSRRVDVLLTLISAWAAGLALLSQTDILGPYFLVAALISVLGLLAVGITNFLIIIQRDVVTVDYIRAINRIRAYFAQEAPHIQSFLLMPTSSDRPQYRVALLSGHLQIVMVITSLLTGAALALLEIILKEGVSFDTALHASLSAVTMYVLQRFYAEIFYRREEAKKAQKSGSAHAEVSATASSDKQQQTL